MGLTDADRSPLSRPVGPLASCLTSFPGLRSFLRCDPGWLVPPLTGPNNVETPDTGILPVRSAGLPAPAQGSILLPVGQDGRKPVGRDAPGHAPA